MSILPCNNFSLSISSLREYYCSVGSSPVDVINEVYKRIQLDGRDDVWINLRPLEDSLQIAEHLMGKSRDNFSLFGVPFSVKDNIDVDGLHTTAACPTFSYRPSVSANVVRRLEHAGAICIGKTNLDQFATGLNGTRSPYGPCRSAFNLDYASGGSSSGSAVSVALHQVSFSIGTDTGGSGRIPASLNNIFGLKPTVGSLSSHGLVPCCPSLDCPSVFSLSVDDALEVAQTMYASDPSDPTLRLSAEAPLFSLPSLSSDLCVLVPQPEQLEFFDNADGHNLYIRAVDYVRDLGFKVEFFDFAPFVEAGNFLFDGPWLADRYASIGAFLEDHPLDVLDTTYGIVQKGSLVTGEQVFKAQERVQQIKAKIRLLAKEGQLFLFPTVAPLCTVSQIQANPVELNNQFGYYSYFANVLDLCAFSFPFAFYPNGMPFGLTVMAPAFNDGVVAYFAKAFTDSLNSVFGKSRFSLS